MFETPSVKTYRCFWKSPASLYQANNCVTQFILRRKVCSSWSWHSRMLAP